MAQGPTKGVPIDTDGSLSANSDLLVPSEKAVVSYVTTAVNAIVVPASIPDGRRYWMATQNKGAGTGNVNVSAPLGTQRVDTFSSTAGVFTYTGSATPITSGTTFVAKNGLILATTSYSISSNQVTLTADPGNGALITWGYFTTNLGFSGTINIESFTGSGGTDFTLAHTPQYIFLVASGGLVQITSAYAIIGGNVLRFSSPVTTGKAVNITYIY